MMFSRALCCSSSCCACSSFEFDSFSFEFSFPLSTSLTWNAIDVVPLPIFDLLTQLPSRVLDRSVVGGGRWRRCFYHSVPRFRARGAYSADLNNYRHGLDLFGPISSARLVDCGGEG